MTKKEIAISFLQLAGMGEVQKAFTEHVAPNFIHHNQYFKGDRSSLLQAMQEAHQTHPNKAIRIKHCYQDGETVITHALVEKAEIDYAVVHIFRFEGNKIAELWDLGQAVEKDMPNQYGLF